MLLPNVPWINLIITFFNQLSVHPSGVLALSVSKDKTLKTWSLITGRAVHTVNLQSLPDLLVLSVCMYVCQYVCISVHVCMYVCMSVCLSVCLSVFFLLFIYVEPGYFVTYSYGILCFMDNLTRKYCSDYLLSY